MLSLLFGVSVISDVTNGTVSRTRRLSERIGMLWLPFLILALTLRRSIKQNLFKLGYSEADFPSKKPEWVKILGQPRQLTDRSA